MEPTKIETKVRHVVTDTSLLLLASKLRDRAEEVLVQAEAMRDPDAQRKMCGIAASYAKLAERIEQHAYDVEKV